MTLPVTQAYDRAQIREVAHRRRQGSSSTSSRAPAPPFSDRDGWLKPHQRIAVLERLARLLDAEAERACAADRARRRQAARRRHRRGARAVDGVRNGVDELRNFGGQRDPDGPHAGERRALGVHASASRSAWWRRSRAFNHPLNLIVHQVVPAIATGCPVIVKPASTTPLCCVAFVELVREAGLVRSVVRHVLAAGQRARREARHRSARRVPQLHRLGARGLVAAQQARARHALRARARRRGAVHRRSRRRPRRDHRADRQGRLLPRGPGLRVDPAHLRARGRSRRVRASARRSAWRRCAWAIRARRRPRSAR